MNEARVAIVTGAASGIGRATSLMLAKEGYRIVVSDIDAVSGQATTEQILEAGGEAITVHTDVTQDSACESMVAQTLERFGRLDAAFNNAGTAGYPLFATDYRPEQWQQVIDVNLTGVFNCMRHELLAMKRSGLGGAIINTSSIMGLKGIAGGSAYCAAKHGVIGLTKAAALECGRDKIRINVVCPGYIKTPMTIGEEAIFGDGFLENAVKRAPIRRMAEPEEVAEMVVWLCSQRASFVTGAVFTVDGGIMAGA